MNNKLLIAIAVYVVSVSASVYIFAATVNEVGLKSIVERVWEGNK